MKLPVPGSTHTGYLEPRQPGLDNPQLICVDRIGFMISDGGE